MPKYRERIDLGTINEEGVRLIAKLGAQPIPILRHVVEDLLQQHIKGKRSFYWLVKFIVHSLRVAPERTEDVLIGHGLWTSAKRR